MDLETDNTFQPQSQGVTPPPQPVIPADEKVPGLSRFSGLKQWRGWMGNLTSKKRWLWGLGGAMLIFLIMAAGLVILMKKPAGLGKLKELITKKSEQEQTVNQVLISGSDK